MAMTFGIACHGFFAAGGRGPPRRDGRRPPRGLQHPVQQRQGGVQGGPGRGRVGGEGGTMPRVKLRFAPSSILAAAVARVLGCVFGGRRQRRSQGGREGPVERCGMGHLVAPTIHL